MWAVGRSRDNKSSTKPKQNYPRETFNHNSAPKNLEYDPRRLIAENDNVKKTIRKKTEEEYVTKNINIVF